MKIVVVSDSHGNIVNLKHVLGFAKKIKAGAIVHCGDWNNVISVETVIDSGIDLFTVLGNADIDENLIGILKTKSKKFSEKLLQVEIFGKKIGVIHKPNEFNGGGHNLDILFFGHTHRQKESLRGGLRVVNPGALASEVFFAIYDTSLNKVELIKL